MRKSEHIVFKPYLWGQLQLPTDLETLVPKGRILRVVDEAVEKMDLRPRLRQYKGGATSSFHPKMMLKVRVYSDSQRRHSECKRCGWKRACTRAAGNRWIQISFPLEQMRARAGDNLHLSGARSGERDGRCRWKVSSGA